jgi:hypothetical protein
MGKKRRSKKMSSNYVYKNTLLLVAYYNLNHTWDEAFRLKIVFMGNLSIKRKPNEKEVY